MIKKTSEFESVESAEQLFSVAHHGTRLELVRGGACK